MIYSSFYLDDLRLVAVHGIYSRHVLYHHGDLYMKPCCEKCNQKVNDAICLLQLFSCRNYRQGPLRYETRIQGGKAWRRGFVCFIQIGAWWLYRIAGVVGSHTQRGWEIKRFVRAPEPFFGRGKNG
jgi:hypothetical protein